MRKIPSPLPSVPIGFHVMLRLADDRPLARTVAALRVIACVVLAQGDKRGLLAFGTADDHLRALLATDRLKAGAFALYVEIALGRLLRPGVRFERARINALQDQRHAYNTFGYVQRQDSRHELDRDLAREGTSLPDLLGIRMLGTSIGARVREHLPRVRIGELTGSFPAGVFENDRPIDLGVLADAAAAVFALSDLRGRCADATTARRAAVHVVGRDVPSKLVADCLGLKLRAVQALRTLPPEPEVVRAVHKQALLRTSRQLLDVA